MVALPTLDSGTFAASHATEGAGDEGEGSAGLGSSDAGADGDADGDGDGIEVGADGWDVQPAARRRAATRTAAMRVDFMNRELPGSARRASAWRTKGSSVL
jgi:hypothetical protein